MMSYFLLWIIWIIGSFGLEAKVKVGNYVINNNSVNNGLNIHHKLDNTHVIPVKVEDHRHDRRFRRWSSQHHDITFSFNISSHPVKLQLRENAQSYSNIPVYVISQNGSVIREERLFEEQNTRYYYDDEHGGTFSIQTLNGKRTRMYGTFHFEDKEYSIEYIDAKSRPEGAPYTNSPSNTYEFTIKGLHANGPKIQSPKDREQHYEKPYSFDLSNHSKIRFKTEKHKPTRLLKRTKRSATYNVEVLFVVDYSIYKYWYDKSSGSSQAQKSANAKNAIRQFYAFVVSGMDGRYRSMSPNFMSVAFAGLLISETPGDAPWTENIKRGSSPVLVDAHKGLEAFSSWVKGQTNLPYNDHAMLLTRYSLSSGESSSLEGYAFVSAVCSPGSQSIMEESDDYLMMTVAAHELGHSLGASHDGQGNACKKDDYYIMAPTSLSKVGNPNPWRFSSCSVSYFQKMIQTLDQQRRNCLTSFGKNYNPNALTPYLSKLPGQLYTADQQCVTYHGKGSSLCRELYKGDFRPMCGLMWCRENSGGCRGMVPADGTMCANKHWCLNGVCTYSSQAAALPDNCVHGDYVGLIDGQIKCADIVAKDKTECYRERIAGPCCQSCNRVSSGITERTTRRRFVYTTNRPPYQTRRTYYTNYPQDRGFTTTPVVKTSDSLPGCEYGDRIPSSLCNKTACPYYSKEELSQCCHSCSAYFIVPTTKTPLPTESDGTNEILIGISVPIVIAAVLLGVWLYRRRRVPTQSGKHMKVKTVQETKNIPSSPPPRKPLSTSANGFHGYNSNKNLISKPTLTSHTNKNLNSEVDKPNTTGNGGIRNLNGDAKTGVKPKPNTSGGIKPYTSVHSKPGDTSEKSSHCINNRNPLANLKNDSKAQVNKASTPEAKILLKHSNQPSKDTKEGEASSSVKDRIAALHNTDSNVNKPISKPTGNVTSNRQISNSSKVVLKPVENKGSAKPQDSKIALRPPGSKTTTSSTKEPPKVSVKPPVKTLSTEPKNTKVTYTAKGGQVSTNSNKGPNTSKPVNTDSKTKGNVSSGQKDQPKPPEYKPIVHGPLRGNIKHANV